MPVVKSFTDPEALTLTVVTEHVADVDRVWQLWEDPRQLEQWWGPPTWPATFSRHEFTPGGGSDYYMTGPEGERAGGWWKFKAIEVPNRIEFEDGFAPDADGNVPTSDSTRIVVTLEPVDGGTRMTVVTHFPSAETLELMLKMGMQEGMGEAMGQIDDVLVGAKA